MATHANLETRTEIPLDILENIAKALGDEIRRFTWLYAGDSPQSRTALDTLKMLSLTCKSTVALCRRHIFTQANFVYLDRAWPREQKLQWRIERNHFLLSQPVVTAHYLKVITVNTTLEFDTSDFDLLRMICDTSDLTSVTIWLDNDWNTVPEKKRTSILSLLQKPLDKLRIYGNFFT